jgi:hypothetical protein
MTQEFSSTTFICTVSTCALTCGINHCRSRHGLLLSVRVFIMRENTDMTFRVNDNRFLILPLS